MPKQLTLNKTMASIFGNAGELQATISLPATGFISGQIIPITFDVKNNSDVEINRVKVILERKEEIIFSKDYIQKNQHSSRNVAQICCSDFVHANSSKKMQLLLAVPPLQPDCNIPHIMSWSYELKV